jgi:diguanylate cyclase (GGDEF)-like protein
MMLDINDFKQKNDTYGHDEGDRVLVETGKLLSETFGEDHCYRYGGDEFLVIVPDVSETEFSEKLESMRQKGSVLMGDSKVSFSAGYVHELLKDPDMLRELISKADERMYEEKHQRR